jgi:hypothetical protein
MSDHESVIPAPASLAPPTGPAPVIINGVDITKGPLHTGDFAIDSARGQLSTDQLADMIAASIDNDAKAGEAKAAAGDEKKGVPMTVFVIYTAKTENRGTEKLTVQSTDTIKAIKVSSTVQHTYSTITQSLYATHHHNLFHLFPNVRALE